MTVRGTDELRLFGLPIIGGVNSSSPGVLQVYAQLLRRLRQTGASHSGAVSGEGLALSPALRKGPGCGTLHHAERRRLGCHQGCSGFFALQNIDFAAFSALGRR